MKELIKVIVKQEGNKFKNGLHKTIINKNNIDSKNNHLCLKLR